MTLLASVSQATRRATPPQIGPSFGDWAQVRAFLSTRAHALRRTALLITRAVGLVDLVKEARGHDCCKRVPPFGVMLVMAMPIQLAFGC